MRQLVLGFLCTVFSVQGFASAEYDLYSPDRTIHVIVKETKNLDPTRPINDASGWTHHKTDIWTAHCYVQNPEEFKNYLDPKEKGKIFTNYAVQKFKNQPYVLDEYGGIGWVFKSLSVAKNNSDQNIYIQSIKLNGQSLDRFWITHQEIIAGGILEMEMGPTPNIK